MEMESAKLGKLICSRLDIKHVIFDIYIICKYQVISAYWKIWYGFGLGYMEHSMAFGMV